MGPLLLTSFYLSPIWGGSRITRTRGIDWSDDDRHGEAFDVSAHPTTMGVVRNGPCDGMTLADAIASYHQEILGDVPDDAPLQVTFMDPVETLSVQVHPSEEYAQAAEGDHGKVEAWYVLDAEPDATLIAGCTTNDTEALRVAAADDSIGDRYGQRIEMHEGDFILIPLEPCTPLVPESLRSRCPASATPPIASVTGDVVANSMWTRPLTCLILPASLS